MDSVCCFIFFFASAFSFFIKIGLEDIPSDLGTLLRTVIIFDTSLIDSFLKTDALSLYFPVSK